MGTPHRLRSGEPGKPTEPKQAWASRLAGPGERGQSNADAIRRDAKSHLGFLQGFAPSLRGFIPRRKPPAMNMSDGTGCRCLIAPLGPGPSVTDGA